MRIKVLAYVVVGSDGQERADVCTDSSDGICVGGLDAKGKYQQFELEAYHLSGWASEHGMGYRKSEVTIEI